MSLFYHRYISDDQANQLDEYLADTQNGDDEVKAAEERERKQREQNDGGCVVQ